jgi:hypothetical protein
MGDAPRSESHKKHADNSLFGNSILSTHESSEVRPYGKSQETRFLLLNIVIETGEMLKGTPEIEKTQGHFCLCDQGKTMSSPRAVVFSL